MIFLLGEIKFRSNRIYAGYEFNIFFSDLSENKEKESKEKIIFIKILSIWSSGWGRIIEEEGEGIWKRRDK